jgi:pimeloyl-ACP methyl ester carboxylesterase
MSIFSRILLTMSGLLLVVYAGLVGYAYWPYGEGIPATELAGADDQFLTTNGHQFRYRAWGEPRDGQPAIVLIHGFANSSMSFLDLGEELASDHYVIALDMLGFGLSDKPVDHNYGNEAQAQTVIEFIEALGLDEVVIGGHSMGGAHAVHIAIDSPRVVGMILFNPGIITTGVPPATQYFVFPLPRLAAKTFSQRAFRQSFLRSSYVNPEIVTEARLDELMLTTQSEGYIEGVTTLMSYYVAGNEIEILDEVRVPTLIIWGADDKRKPMEEATQLDSMLETSRLIILEKAGHYVHEEQPQQAANAIREADDFWATRR